MDLWVLLDGADQHGADGVAGHVATGKFEHYSLHALSESDVRAETPPECPEDMPIEGSARGCREHWCS